jgi:LPXTG-motif cell wall-anchored protein
VTAETTCNEDGTWNATFRATSKVPSLGLGIAHWSVGGWSPGGWQNLSGQFVSSQSNIANETASVSSGSLDIAWGASYFDFKSWSWKIKQVWTSGDPGASADRPEGCVVPPPPCPEGQQRAVDSVSCEWPPCETTGMVQSSETGSCSWPPCPSDGMLQSSETGTCSWEPCPSELMLQANDTGECSWPPCEDQRMVQDSGTGDCSLPECSAGSERFTESGDCEPVCVFNSSIPASSSACVLVIPDSGEVITPEPEPAPEPAPVPEEEEVEQAGPLPTPTEPAAPPTPAPAPTPSPAPQVAATLPSTGSSSAVLAVLGACLALAGVTLVRLGGRRPVES